MTFGDFDPADALDHEPADPEQLARKLHEVRREMEVDAIIPPWDALGSDRRIVLIAVATRVLAWLRRQGAF